MGISISLFSHLHIIGGKKKQQPTRRLIAIGRQTIRRARDYGDLKNARPVSHEKLAFFRPSHPIFKGWQLIHDFLKTLLKKYCGSYYNVSQIKRFWKPTRGLQFPPLSYNRVTMFINKSCKDTTLFSGSPPVSAPQLSAVPALQAALQPQAALHSTGLPHTTYFSTSASCLSPWGWELPPLKKGCYCLEESHSGCLQMSW